MTAHDPRVTLTEAEVSLLSDLFERSHFTLLIGEVESIIAARLAPVRALAEGAGDLDNGILVWDLRAALDASSAPLGTSQDHDGAKGQGEGEKPADRRCPTCGIPFAHYTHDPQGRPL